MSSSPGPNDVLLGRNKTASKHEGNKQFRRLIAAHSERYGALTERTDKSKTVRFIAEEVHKTGGKFLRKGPNETWVEVTKKETSHKIGHALRDAFASSQRARALSRIANTLQTEPPAPAPPRQCLPPAQPRIPISIASRNVVVPPTPKFSNQHALIDYHKRANQGQPSSHLHLLGLLTHRPIHRTNNHLVAANLVHQQAQQFFNSAPAQPMHLPDTAVHLQLRAEEQSRNDRSKKPAPEKPISQEPISRPPQESHETREKLDSKEKTLDEDFGFQSLISDGTDLYGMSHADETKDGTEDPLEFLTQALELVDEPPEDELHDFSETNSLLGSEYPMEGMEDISGVIDTIHI